ncbi:MAG: hypothetical protein Kow0010_02220 [Dehalococcoidia bacterium]
MRILIIVLSIVGALAFVGLGLVIAQGPQPEIIVPAERITKVGPLTITNTLITAWMVMAFLIVFSFLATRSMKLLPSGLQNFVEAAIEFLYDQVVSIAGEKNGRKFFMVVATFFIFIIVSNWSGLLPFFNAIGRTEDVGHEIFHEIEQHAAHDEAFAEDDHFVAWKVDKTGGIGLVKPRAADVEFEVHEGQMPGEVLDAYIVFLAKEYTDFEPHDEGHVTREDLVAATEALQADPDAPKLLFPAEGHDDAHGVESALLGHDLVVAGVDFPGQKLALIIPLFRSVYSDVNNTLALAIASFVIVEFWGFSALGFAYLGKFFVNPLRNPIGTFVGFLELLSEFIRIISFAFRLFGNIFAGEVLILMLTFLMPFLLVNVIYGLELFVGFIQAAVFALLTLVFAVMAVEHHGDEEHGHDEGHPELGESQAH